MAGDGRRVYGLSKSWCSWYTYGRRVSCCAELMVSSGLESILFDIQYFSFCCIYTYTIHAGKPFGGDCNRFALVATEGRRKRIGKKEH